MMYAQILTLEGGFHVHLLLESCFMTSHPSLEAICGAVCVLHYTMCSAQHEHKYTENVL